jgi:plastocyanin
VVGRRNGIRLVALVSVLALAAVACGGKKAATGGGGNTVSIAGQDANDHGAKDVSGMSSLELELDDFYFNPTVLEGTAGQTLTLEAKSEGKQTHTFTIAGANVDQEFAPDSSHSIEVTFPDSGILVFECTFHAGRGMRGALSVGPLSEADTGSSGPGGGVPTSPPDTGYGY